MNDTAYIEAVELLKQLIAIPSFSKEEEATADLLQTHLHQKGIIANRLMNNVWVRNKYYDISKPTLLLNSHHDTVRPNAAYTKDPFAPLIEDGKLYGLGSNDAGGCLVSLLAAFLHFYNKPGLKYNIFFAATAEEELSGTNGIDALLPELGNIDCAVVGEPTQMHMAIAEKGLMVLDCVSKGIAGHAARDEGQNAIYKAMEDIAWFGTYQFHKKSELLGPVKMNVTIVNAGTQHNVIPAECRITVDVRLNEHYTHDEALGIIESHIQSEVTPRSKRLRSTSIDINHPLVQAGEKIGLPVFGSSTMSDKALMPFPALKIGPGDSARSHSADEFIYLSEIEEGVSIYIQLLEQLL